MKFGIQLKKPIAAWLNNQLELGKLGQIKITELLAPDTSLQPYYRIHLSSQKTLILWHACHTWDHQNFVHIAHYWQSAGIDIANILAHDTKQGLFLFEDTGDKTLLQTLHAMVSKGKPQYHAIKSHYTQALTRLLSIQQLHEPQNFILPTYTETLLWNEIQCFQEWLLQEWLAIELTETEQHEFAQITDWLVKVIQQQPYIWTHRHYHAAHLKWIEATSIKASSQMQERLIITNYQDAIWGPITYDLASLLRDTNISWPAYFVTELISIYLNLYKQTPLYETTDQRFHFNESQFYLWFDCMSLQQHLKNSGMAAKHYLENDQSEYLSNIPRMLLSISRIAGTYQQTRFLQQLIKTSVLPMTIKKLNY